MEAVYKDIFTNPNLNLKYSDTLIKIRLPLP